MIDEDYNVEINSEFNYSHNNSISTSKYRWYNCVPYILIEQFSKMANIYFLIIAVMQVNPIKHTLNSNYNNLT